MGSPGSLARGRPVLEGLTAGLLAAGLAAAQDSQPNLPEFVDVTDATGIEFRNASSATSQKYLMEAMVGGVATLDFDQDGLLDLYFVNGAELADPMPEGRLPDKSDPRYWNRLYRNEGAWRFSDVTQAAGVQGDHYGQGVAAADYDNDGFPDLFLANYGRNTLFRNRGDGTFEDVTDFAGVRGGGWSAAAGFMDYDRDGNLDLFVTRYVEWSFEGNPWCGERKPGYRSYCHPKQFKPISHLAYRNNGDGTFTESSDSTGFGAVPGKGLGIAFNDFDRDGWIDVLVANDSFPQQLFRNVGGATFEEVALLSGLAYDENGRTFAGMGTDFADYSNDGLPDVFINALAHQGYALFRNEGPLFEYVSGQTGVSEISTQHSGWGAKFVDYDNDGLRDIFVAQGHVMDNIELTQPDLQYEEPLALMRNTGDGFVDVSSSSGDPFQVDRAARGAAFADLDNDGFVDVAINCRDGRAVILRNTGNENGWLSVDLEGRQSNRDGIGALVRVMSEAGAEQHGIVSRAGSYLSSGDGRLHFGLGSDSVVQEVSITWPSGTVQSLEQVPANQILKIAEPESEEP